MTGFAYGLEAILGQVYLVAEFLQHPHGHSLVYRVVLGEQQPTLAGARGGYLAGLAFRGPRLTEAEGRRERLVELGLADRFREVCPGVGTVSHWIYEQGRYTVKVEPSSGMLRTFTWPPCFSAM